MSVKVCPLLMIAGYRDPGSLSEKPYCLEGDCAWWRRYKTGHDCVLIVLTLYLEGIGRLAAFDRQQRRVGIQT